MNIYLIDDQTDKHDHIGQDDIVERDGAPPTLVSAVQYECKERGFPPIRWKNGFGLNGKHAHTSADLLTKALTDDHGVILLDLRLLNDPNPIDTYEKLRVQMEQRLASDDIDHWTKNADINRMMQRPELKVGGYIFACAMASKPRRRLIIVSTAGEKAFIDACVNGEGLPAIPSINFPDGLYFEDPHRSFLNDILRLVAGKVVDLLDDYSRAAGIWEWHELQYDNKNTEWFDKKHDFEKHYFPIDKVGSSEQKRICDLIASPLRLMKIEDVTVDFPTAICTLKHMTRMLRTHGRYEVPLPLVEAILGASHADFNRFPKCPLLHCHTKPGGLLLAFYRFVTNRPKGLTKCGPLGVKCNADMIEIVLQSEFQDCEIDGQAMTAEELARNAQTTLNSDHRNRHGKSQGRGYEAYRLIVRACQGKCFARAKNGKLTIEINFGFGRLV